MQKLSRPTAAQQKIKNKLCTAFNHYSLYRRLESKRQNAALFSFIRRRVFIESLDVNIVVITALEQTQWLWLVLCFHIS